MKTISYADIDMSNAEGRETLRRRLNLAARQVCGSQSITNVGLARANRNRVCAAHALDSALAKVRNNNSNVAQVGVAAASQDS